MTWTPPITKTTGKPCQRCTKHNKPCTEEHANGEPAPGGRPTKLTPELTLKASDLVAQGTHVKDVWAHPKIDIDEKTYYSWLDQGRQHNENNLDTLEAQFFRAIARAEGEAHDLYHTMLRDSLVRRSEVVDKNVLPARIDPRTGKKIVGEDVRPYDVMQYLARRWPDRWSEKRILKHEGSGGGPVEFRVIMTEEES